MLFGLSGVRSNQSLERARGASAFRIAGRQSWRAAQLQIRWPALGARILIMRFECLVAVALLGWACGPDASERSPASAPVAARPLSHEIQPPIAPPHSSAPTSNPSLLAWARAGQPLRVGGEVKAPVVVRRISPNFESVRNVLANGVPIFEVLVSASGEVGDIRVLKSTNQRIDAVIIDALKQWQFRPATLYGEPVAVYYVIPLSLDSR